MFIKTLQPTYIEIIYNSLPYANFVYNSHSFQYSLLNVHGLAKIIVNQNSPHRLFLLSGVLLVPFELPVASYVYNMFHLHPDMFMYVFKFPQDSSSGKN